MNLRDQLDSANQRFAPPLPDRPPALIGDDVPLYAAWRLNPIPQPLGVYFNVRVGPEAPVIRDPTDPIATLEAQLLSLRIDALVDDGSTWWILEFHRNAGLAQFGRLYGYRTLFGTTYAPDTPPNLLAIAYTVNPYLLALFTASAIGVALIDPQTQELELTNPQAYAPK